MELIQRIFIILHVKVALWVWSDVQVEQLAVAACVWLQLQNMEDESRGTTANSNERSLRSGRAGVVKVGEFPFKFRFRKQLEGTNRTAERQFITLSMSR